MVLISLFCGLGYYFLDYGLNILLANILSLSDYGDYAMAITWGWFCSYVVILGGAQTIIKFYPKYAKYRDDGRLSGLIIFYSVCAIIAGLFIAITASFLSYVDVVNLPEHGTNKYHPFLLGLFCTPLIALSMLNSALFKSTHRVVMATAPSLIILPILVIFGTVLSYYFGVHVHDWYVMGLYFISFVIVLIGQYLLLARVIKIRIFQPVITFEKRQWLMISIPIMFGAINFYLLRQADLTMLEILSSKESSVGLYAAISKTNSIFYVASGAIATVFLPFIARTVDSHDESRVHTYRRVFYFNIIIGLVIFSVIALCGQQILYWFNMRGHGVYPAMLVLALGTYSNIIASTALFYLQYSRHSQWIVYLDFLALFMAVLMNLFLIPRFDVMGAALATSIALFVRAILQFGLVYYLFQMLPLILPRIKNKQLD